MLTKPTSWASETIREGQRRHQPHDTRPRTLPSGPARTVAPLAYVHAHGPGVRDHHGAAGAGRVGRRSGRGARDRPSIRSTSARNGVTSSPNGHVPSAGPRATGRTTPVAPACTAPTPAASGRTGGAVERSSRPRRRRPPHRSGPEPARACTPSAPTATWWPGAATPRAARSPRAGRSRAPHGTARRSPGTRNSSPAGLRPAERAPPCCTSSRPRWRRCSNGRCGTPRNAVPPAERPPCSPRLQCSDGEQQTAPGNPS